MVLAKEKKKELIANFKKDEKDTGSPEAQISILSAEIGQLVSHLKKHPKDLHSKRGLLKMVSKRKTLLNYLKNEDEKRYQQVTKKVNLEK